MTFQELSDYNDLYMLQEADWSGLGKRAAATGAAAAALAGGSQFINTPPTTDQPAAIVQPAAQPAAVDPIMDVRFINYVKSVENSKSNPKHIGGWDNIKKKWYQYGTDTRDDYREGGADTIGWGHKLKRGEAFPDGLTDEQAYDLLIQDLKIHENLVKRDIGIDVYNSLDTNRKQMLIDFAFNLGNIWKKEFPKFTRAVIDNNIPVMRAEYHRYSRGKLLGRNDVFYNTFLKTLNK